MSLLEEPVTPISSDQLAEELAVVPLLVRRDSETYQGPERARPLLTVVLPVYNEALKQMLMMKPTGLRQLSSELRGRQSEFQHYAEQFDWRQ